MIMQSVTWGQYLMCMGAFIFVYYMIFFVAVKMLARKSSVTNSLTKSPVAATRSLNKTSDAQFAGNLKDKEQRDFLYPVVHEAVNELQAFLQSTGTRSNQKEITSGLTIILKKYPTLRKGNFRGSINNLIYVTCETHCSIQLSADDLRAVWDDDDDGANSRPPHSGGEVLESI